jgi:hypothetical protein
VFRKVATSDQQICVTIELSNLDQLIVLVHTIDDRRQTFNVNVLGSALVLKLLQLNLPADESLQGRLGLISFSIGPLRSLARGNEPLAVGAEQSVRPEVRLIFYVVSSTHDHVLATHLGPICANAISTKSRPTVGPLL